MIPKVIHYCWFGGNPLSESEKKCINSWKKYCPDYKIKRWDESNFDFKKCQYIEEAYKAKKWAFVSDYARFWILYNYGGIYFDTDVEMLKNIDRLVEKGAFFGRERRDGEKNVLVSAGLGMGCEANNPLYKEILDKYNQLHFIKADGTYNKKTVVEHVSELLYKHGLPRYCEKTDLIYKVNDITIYPWEFFGPISYKNGDIKITENTYTIHHYTASWKSEEEVMMKKITDKLRMFFGENAGGAISKVICYPLRFKAKVKEIGLKGTMKLLILGASCIL